MMLLHILLTILRIIGIVLLVLLGILLLVILLLMFVPLRYRLHAKKEGERFEADGRMTWLLHLLRADVTYRDGEGTAVIRLCSFRFRTFCFPGNGAKEGPDAAGEADAAAGDGTPPHDDTTVNTVDTGKADRRKTVEAGVTSGTGTPPADDTGGTGNSAPAGALPESGADDVLQIGRKDSSQEENASRVKERNPDAAPRKGVIGRLGDLAVRIFDLVLDLILQIPALPAEVHDRIERIQETIRIRTGDLSRRIDPYLSIEAEHMFWKSLRYMKYLIRGYAPRKITGYIRFGTGAPDLTGTLTGLIYVLLPESGTEYEVDPDFYDTVFETETDARGHIRMYRMAWVGIHMLVDKEFWRLLGRIRGKDPSAKKHRFGKRKKNAEA